MLVPLFLLLLAGPQARKPARTPQTPPLLIRETVYVDDRVRVQERVEIELQWAADVTLSDRTLKHGDFTTHNWYRVEYVDTIERLDASGEPAQIRREYLSASRSGDSPPSGPPSRRAQIFSVPDFIRPLVLPPHTVFIIEKADGKVKVTPLNSLSSVGDLRVLEGVFAPSDAAFFPTQPVSVGDRWELLWRHPERMFGLSGTARLKGSLRELVLAGPRSSAKADIELRVDAKAAELPLTVTMDLTGAARTATWLHRPLGLYLRGPIAIEGSGSTELREIRGNVLYELKATGTVTFRRSWTWLAVGGKPTAESKERP